MNRPNKGRILLRLELDPGSEPISGSLVTAEGTEEEFSGWLTLAAAIERAAHVTDNQQEAVT
jgi:hypothetical protein